MARTKKTSKSKKKSKSTSRKKSASKKGKSTSKKGSAEKQEGRSGRRGASAGKKPKSRKKAKGASEEPAERVAEAPERAGDADADATPRGVADATPLTEADADAPTDPAEDAQPVVDLDAEDDAGDDVDRLIAETLATVQADEPPGPETPVIDLDAEADDEVAARDTAESVATVEVAESPSIEVAREPGERSADQSAGSQDDTPEAGTARDRDDAEPPEEQMEPEPEPVDPDPVSSPDFRARLLAEALAHAEHQDALYRIPFAGAAAARGWKALLALVLLLVAGVISLAPPRWTRPDPPAQLERAELARNLRVALLLQAQQVEAFRVRTRRLPDALDEVSQTLHGIRYVRSGSRAYQLIAYEPDGNAIVYDSANPTPAFDALTTGWALPEPTP